MNLAIPGARARQLPTLILACALGAFASTSAHAGKEAKAMKLVVHPAPLSSKPSTFRIKLPEGAAAQLKGSGPALLRFDGLESGAQTALLLRVFVAAPEATLATSTDDKRFVGNLTVVAAGKTAKGKKTQSVNAQLEVLPEARAQIAAAGELSVTLVPTDVDGKEPAAVEFTIKKISLDL